MNKELVIKDLKYLLKKVKKSNNVCGEIDLIVKTCPMRDLQGHTIAVDKVGEEINLKLIFKEE